MAKRKKPPDYVEREVERINGQQQEELKRIRKIDPERQRIFNERIELARQLLRENWSEGDVIRAFKKQYGIGKRQIYRYLSLARKRNLQLIDRTEDEITAYSIGFWAKQQRDCTERIQQAKARIQKAEQEIETCRAILDSPNASVDKQKIALDRMKVANKTLDDARRTIYSAEMLKMSCQDRHDKIMAPGKYNRVEKAEVTKEGENVNVAAPEPVNDDKTQDGLLELVEKVRKRMEPSES